VQVTIVTAGAASPHNVAASAAGFLTVLSSPTASTFTPLAGYQSSTITVGGANFVTPAQGGSCQAFSGVRLVVSCFISSKSFLTIGFDEVVEHPIYLNVVFNFGGFGAQFFKSTVSFHVGFSDRVVGKLNVSATVSFAIIRQLLSGSLISLCYPFNFFNSSVVPSVLINNGAFGSAISLTPSCMSIRTAYATLAPLTTVSVTLLGAVIGSPARSETSFPDLLVATSSDNSSFFGTLSGRIGDRVANFSFQISSGDRRAGKIGSAVSFSFLPSLGGELSINSSIILSFPFGFFSLNSSPTVSISGGVLGTAAPPSPDFIVIVLKHGTISAGVSVSVTLSGITMGSRSLGENSSARLFTSSDLNPSNVYPSGGIFNKVLVDMFQIAKSDRVASKTNVSATFSFTSTVQGALPQGSSITMMYPSNFFSLSVNVSVSISGGAFGKLSDFSDGALRITTSGATLPAGVLITITLQGLTIGPTSMGQKDEIVVTTSADTDLSDAISTGMIGSRVSIGVFVIAGTGRMQSKTIASVTFSFTPSHGGALIPGSTITLMFPSDFLAIGNHSVAAISGGASGIATSPIRTSIIITTFNASLSSSIIITITLTGLILDSSNGASSGGVIISTSSDVFPVSYWGGCSCAHSPVIENDFCQVSS
jgi:hypothetical protein